MFPFYCIILLHNNITKSTLNKTVYQLKCCKSPIFIQKYVFVFLSNQILFNLQAIFHVVIPTIHNEE